MKNKNLVIAILAVIILIIASFLFKISIIKPPVIRFIDENNLTVNGVIYLDNAYIGETMDGEFKNLPKDYCKTTRNLTLKTANTTFEWASYPVDCKFEIVTYTVKIEIIKK